MEIKEQKVIEIRKQIDDLLYSIEEKAVKGSDLHTVELNIFESLLQVGLSLLNYFIILSCEIVKQSGVPDDSQGVKMYNSGTRERRYRSIFGTLSVKRTRYYSREEGKIFYPLDKRLSLPAGVYSYLLQDWLSYGAVDLDFQASVDFVGRILNQSLHGIQSGRLTYDFSSDVEDFYEDFDWEEQQEGSHLVAGYDGKGVPIIRSQTEQAPQSVSVRLGRGQSKGVKKEAVVSLTSSFTPRKRTVKQIIDSLFETYQREALKQSTNRHKWHDNKHIRAFLSQKQRAIDYGLDNLLKRDKSGKKPIVILVDGDRSLKKAVERGAVQKGITHRIDAYVLDLIHVIEYIWKVANAYIGEKNEHRVNWVKKQVEDLLNGSVQQVIKNWKQLQSAKKYSVNQAYNIQRGITYFENHQSMMKYDEYLSKGYPITTGAVESACGHFVKSRMERNAMHWSKEGAQKMLNIRAIKKNEHWEQYTHRYIKTQQDKLYRRAA